MQVSKLWRQPLDDLCKARIEEMETYLLQSEATQLGGLALSDLEETLNSILISHGHGDSWEISAAFAECSMTPDMLTSLLANLDSGASRAALVRIAAYAELTRLLNVVEGSSTRISELVRTVKEYTNMDLAQVQNVDVARSLETTLDTLAHRLQSGIKVMCTYDPAPLLVNTVGTELNQVWTNIIENAIDAMHGGGELRVRTFHEDHYVVVEIGDNGPGIPAEVRPYIFDPFFTTKGVGEGTGLGLNTVQTIVRKLGGNIQVSSRAGDTRFQVWLPFTDPIEFGKQLNSEPHAF